MCCGVDRNVVQRLDIPAMPNVVAMTMRTDQIPRDERPYIASSQNLLMSLAVAP
jgi:hypothetical protein